MKDLERSWEFSKLKYDVFISSYDDRNFFFRVDLESGIRNDFLKPEDINPDGYMLKVTNSLDSKVRSWKQNFDVLNFT